MHTLCAITITGMARSGLPCMKCEWPPSTPCRLVTSCQHFETCDHPWPLWHGPELYFGKFIKCKTLGKWFLSIKWLCEPVPYPRPPMLSILMFFTTIVSPRQTMTCRSNHDLKLENKSINNFYIVWIYQSKGHGHIWKALKTSTSQNADRT